MPKTAKIRKQKMGRERLEQRQKDKSKNRRDIKILIVLIIALLIINYPFLNRQLENFLDLNKEIYVDRIIDGDTIESEIEGNKTSIRLLGINTPERGEFLYDEAKEFLEDGILNKTIQLEFIGDRIDKYDRTLAYVFFNFTNINVKMVENGFANYYFYSGKDKYSDDLLDAWNQCVEVEINLCEKSKNSCAGCVSINSDGGFIINNCPFSCDITNWSVRGEGREKFIFSEQTLTPGAQTSFALNLENTGGSLFLRDDYGKLVEWKN